MSNYTCNQCGTKNVEGSRFCAGCGNTLVAAASPAQPSQQRPFAPPPPMPPPQQQSYAPPPPAQYAPQPAPVGAPSSSPSGRAIASLVLGIAGFVMCGPFTAIPGIIVGKMELNAIRDGQSPQSNEGIAKAGFYVSIGVTVLYTLLFVVALLFGLIPVLLALLNSA